jgi:hypothetical protein
MKPRRVVRKIRSRLLAYLVRELDKRPALYRSLNRPRFLFWELVVKLRGFRRGRLPDVNTTYWIDPGRIEHAVNTRGFNVADRGKVVGGDWDLPGNLIRFEDTDVYRAFHGRFVEHKDWRETAFYKRIMGKLTKGYGMWGCVSEEQLDERLEKIEELYREIRDHGFKSQPTLLDSGGRHSGDEIIVSIGRTGELLFSDGRHRLCIARILGLHQVPVQVGIRHPEWVKFRQQISTEAKLGFRGQLYQPLPHPDLADIPTLYGDERFEIIRKHLSLPAGTLLDIGSYFGYFCHRFEDEGFDCYAVEYNPINVFIMDKVRQAENKRFKIFPGSIFDYREKADFDVVLALNIFHHFLKEKRLYDKLVELLGRLKMRQLFFQPPVEDEDQMQGAYRHYTAEEFVDFILENSCLKEAGVIGRTKDGRQLYELH